MVRPRGFEPMTCGSGGLCWERTLAVMSGQERADAHRMRSGADGSGQERGAIMALNWHKGGGGRTVHFTQTPRKEPACAASVR